MAAQSFLKITTGFADDTKREHEFGPYKPNAAAIVNAKSNIAAFNQNISNLSGLYISDGGANCTGIVAAQIVTTAETEINLEAARGA